MNVDRAKEKWQELEKQESKLLEIRKHNQNRKRKRENVEEELDSDNSRVKAENPELKVKGEGQEDSQEDEDLVPEDYYSDEEVKKEEGSDEEGEGKKDEQSHVTKIYYCSRTHSQLAQFVREIIKSPYGSNTRVLSLGSRQNLCVNEAVRKLNSVSLMNDMCLDLQKNKNKGVDSKDGSEKKRKKSSSGGCPFYKQEAMEDLGNQILTEVTEMEQVVTAGMWNYFIAFVIFYILNFLRGCKYNFFLVILQILYLHPPRKFKINSMTLSL